MASGLGMNHNASVRHEIELYRLNSLGFVFSISVRNCYIMYSLGKKFATCVANILGMYEDSEKRHTSALNRSSHKYIFSRQNLTILITDKPLSTVFIFSTACCC